jgi:hypothetical protein
VLAYHRRRWRLWHDAVHLYRNEVRVSGPSDYEEVRKIIAGNRLWGGLKHKTGCADDGLDHL